MNIAFKEAVETFLAPHRERFNFDNMVNNHVDISRFYHWVDQVNVYRSIAGSTVLSSGCGSAGDLFAFHERGASKVFGIEVDGALIDLAKKRFETCSPDICDFRVYEGRILPYESNFFDVIVSIHVLEHTTDVRCYLTELFRVLKPGGVIYLDLPNRYYYLEQHTLIPYIHYLPTRIRDGTIRFVIKHKKIFRLREDMPYLLDTLTDYHIPTARYIMDIFGQCQGRYALELADAFFHSYSASELHYRPTNIPGVTGKTLPYLVGKARKHSSFRFVVRKRRM